MEYCAVIMAGGRGTRFWPKSTENKPKQFLNLVSDRTMLQLTFDRINKMIAKEKIFVVTCMKYKELVMKQLPDLQEKNIIVEPEGRNTAPCILLATLYINQIYSDAAIAIFPSDHIINTESRFIDELKEAFSYLENKNKNAIVTIGITPTRPETGYGYIKAIGKNSKQEKYNVLKVDKFVEKPDLIKAKKYIEEGQYLWNAGMFIFSANYMLEELKKNLKDTYYLLNNLPSIDKDIYQQELEKVYHLCDSISIDYAVMEKSDSIYVIPSRIDWDDIGTWNSLQRYIEPDELGNTIKGNVDIINSENNTIYSGDKRVVLVGVNSIFFIESDDLIVIGNKEDINEVAKYRNEYEKN